MIRRLPAFLIVALLALGPIGAGRVLATESGTSIAV